MLPPPVYMRRAPLPALPSLQLRALLCAPRCRQPRFRPPSLAQGGGRHWTARLSPPCGLYLKRRHSRSRTVEQTAAPTVAWSVAAHCRLVSEPSSPTATVIADVYISRLWR